MESIYNFSDAELIGFALVLIRVSALVVSMPVIGGGTIAPPVKVLFALGITFVLFPTVGWQKLALDISDVEILNLAVKEAFVGLCFGFLARMFFQSLAMAGQIVSVSMGISSVQLFNPMMEESSGAFDQFMIILGTLFFLAVNGHHIFIGGLVNSYEIIPIAQYGVSFLGFESFGAVVHEIMIISVKLAAPVMVTILFSNVALAVVGRAVPQINILITSLPVNSMLGFFVIVVSMPVFVHEMGTLLDITAERVFGLLKTI